MNSDETFEFVQIASIEIQNVGSKQKISFSNNKLQIIQTHSNEMIRLEFQEALNDFIDEENDIKISKIVLSLKNAFVDQNGAV